MLSLISINEAIQAVSIVYGLKGTFSLYYFFLQSTQALKPCMVQRGDTKKKFLGPPLKHRQSYPASGVPAFRELGHKYAYSQI
jgi:hypothetical protein